MLCIFEQDNVNDKAQEIRKTYEISSETLRRWNNQGKISSIRTPVVFRNGCGEDIWNSRKDK